jgi:hypothetical protein
LDRSGIRFGDKGVELDPNRLEVTIPAGLKTKQELFVVLDSGLRLPDYFGMNWDALDECICDLSWLPPGQIVLAHSDVPLAGDPTNQSTYLSIISDAIARWMNVPDRDLLVTFPVECRTQVEQLR